MNEVDDLLQALRVRMPQAHGDGEGGADDELAAARARMLAGIDGTHAAPPPAGIDTALAGAGPRTPAESDARPSRRRRWVPTAVAAGLVAAVVAGVMLFGLPGAGPASAEARAVLEQAAQSTIVSVDPPQGPDQYRFTGTHAWWLSSAGGDGVDAPVTALVENRLDYWVPTDPSGVWLLDRGPTGEYTVLAGSDADAASLVGGNLTERLTSRCGAFYGPESNQCTGPGSWQVPTPEFLAGLPRDPGQLYDRLSADAPDNSRGDAELLVYAADLLRNPLPVPADLRSALYLALTRVNGLTLTPGAANLEGRTGVALGIDDPNSRVEIIVDPASGTFIGERETTRVELDGLPAGTVTSYTSVTTAVVDELGQLPTG